MTPSIVFTVSNNLTYDQRMQRICTALSENGYNVTLVGRSLKSEKESDFTFNSKRLKCFFKQGVLFYTELNVRLFFYLLFKKFDGVCAVDLDTAIPVWFASRLKNKKFGFDAHEYFQEVPEVVHRKQVKRTWERIASFVIPKTDFRYTVSNGLAQEFKNLYKVDFQIIRNLPVFRASDNNTLHPPFLLYQGALNKGRGLETLIKAAPHLPLSIKIAGEGDLSVKLRQLVAELGLEKNVEFLGYLKPAALKDVTDKAFLGYNILENIGLSYYFSLANKFFDYTMAGVPCLNSPFPEYITLHETYKIGVLTNLTREDIINTVTDLFDNHPKYSQLRSNALIAAKELNWEKEKVNLLAVYNEHLPIS